MVVHFYFMHKIMTLRTDINEVVDNVLGGLPFSVIESEIGIGIAVGNFQSFLTYQQIE
jgi:hypothetical protein